MTPPASGRPRLTAGDRARRLLALIPWVAAHPDGVPIDEVCTRFSIDRRTLSNDLESLLMVGTEAIGPESYLSVFIEDERVIVAMPQWFDRPLRLTPEQGLALVAAGQGLLATPGADPEGPLARGLAKLAAVLGIEEGDEVDVQLPDAPADVIQTLRSAVEEHRQVALDYYAFHRDELTHRTVDPYRVSAEQGAWYLSAHCHEAGDDRLFRIDRIRSATVLDTGFEPRAELPALSTFQPGVDDPSITLLLTPAAAWVAEQYPIEERTDRGDGTIEVTLRIAAESWLERLLLRLGPDASVVAADGDLGTVGARAARRVLARYRD